MDALETILDRTAAALLCGDLSDLHALTRSLEAATPPRDAATLARLRRKAERNAHLLQAATRGVKAARVRLSEITAGPILTTYDAQGRRESVAGGDRAPRRV